MSDVVHGFELLRDQHIAELSTHARLFRHVETGARMLSMENADENKAFGISFFTPPPDSTGVAHIMEHSVLCGSRQYPAKEPFVELRKSSLQTYLNATTYPDKTCYPIASQNLRDFYNLIDVYLDAVFYPRLTPFTLQQEGWHYELETPEAPLTYRGVVFNGMKGNYSSPDNLLYRFSRQSVFPDTLYGFDSGGDPTVIPTLTWEAFKQFHDAYYHPSNAFIYFYGDDDPDQRLRLLAEYLSQFAPAPVEQRIAPQSPFDAPRRVVRPYDPGEGAEPAKGYVTVNWRLVPNDDAERTLGLSILRHVLIATPASPLRKALIDSGLGEDLAGSGLNTQLHTATFSTGLKGVAVENISKVETLIFETLRRLAEHGIDPATIEASLKSLNTIEFGLREQNTGSYPRGLTYMLGALSRWLYGYDPLDALAFEAPLTAIKERVARGERYFEGLVHTYLLDNQQRATVELLPEPGFAARQAAAEAERLAQIKAAMSADELRAVIENTAELKRRQGTPDAPEVLATIPALMLGDMDRTTKLIPLEVSQDQEATILFHDLVSNGIAYVSIGLNLHVLPPRLLPYVGLLRKALLTMGTQREDYVAPSQRIGRETGGLWVSPYASMTAQPAAPAAAWLFLHGKATIERTRDLLAIARDVLTSVKLDDRERFRQILLEEKARLERNLVPGGSYFAALRLTAAFNEADWAGEQLGGITYLLFLQDLAARFDMEWPVIRDTVQHIWWTLLNRRAMVINITIDGQNVRTVRPVLGDFLGAISESTVSLADWTVPLASGREGFAVPALINFVARGINLFEHGYQVRGSYRAILNWLRTTYLWDRVRVQGGAYGGSCGFDSHAGLFTFWSYRDPNLTRTIDTFDAAAQALRTVNLSGQELERSIIGAIGTLDTYQFPDAKGYTSMGRYLRGDTDEMRQQQRDELLATTPSDFHGFGETLEALPEQGRVVVLGSLEALEAANAARPGWLRITKLVV